MKKFKDLKVGDYVYFIFDDEEVKKYSIDRKEERKFFDHIVYLICFKNFPWLNIHLSEYELNKSKSFYRYQDPLLCEHFAYVYTTKVELLNELFERKKNIISKIDKQITFAKKL